MDKLRRAVQSALSCADSEGLRCRRNPGICLMVPADPPRRTAQEPALLPASDDNPGNVAAICAALLAHSGIQPMTTPADAAGAC